MVFTSTMHMQTGGDKADLCNVDWITLDVDTSGTIENVNAKTRDKEGIQEEQQRLTCAGKQLKDEHTLSQQSIPPDNALRLTLRLKSGMTSTREAERHDKRKASESTDGETLK